jgi:hypothetical protein
MREYYMTKKTDCEVFKTTNPQTTPYPDRFKAQINALINVIQRYDERMSIKKGKLVKTIDELGDKVVSQSGFTVLSRATN